MMLYFFIYLSSYCLGCFQSIPTSCVLLNTQKTLKNAENWTNPSKSDCFLKLKVKMGCHMTDFDNTSTIEKIILVGFRRVEAEEIKFSGICKHFQGKSIMNEDNTCMNEYGRKSTLISHFKAEGGGCESFAC